MMASPGNPSPQGGGVPFDMQKFFKPSVAATTPLGVGPNPPATNPNLQYPNSSSSPFPTSCYPSPHSVASYPTPTVGPYSYPPQTSPFHHPQYLHPHIAYLPQQQQDGQFPNLHNQKSMSYPSPPLQPPSPHQFQPQQNSNPNPGSRLMALLSAPPPSILEIPQQLPVPTMPMPPSIQHPSSSGGGSDFSMPPNVPVLPPGTNFNPGVIGHSFPMRMSSSKLPKGRHLVGDHLVYDIDVRLPGEVRPQLEVTPITKYGSDPGLVLGRQIAVNKTYICYGLKLGAIRVLNINTALRSLLKGLSQRVTDMVFFAEDVHILAGASTDGQVYVWKITEDPDEEDKPQITGKIIIAIQIVGDGESVHPRVCWHCHKQEILVVGVGRHVMRIDTTKVGKGEVYSAEEPLKCPVHKLIDGVQLVGTHDGEVTDLSMCQWMMTYLVSASLDGTIKIWEDRKLLPIAVLRPHDGQPVNSVTFLTAPHRPDHITLITGGPLNREVKIWTSASEEGWLLPSDAESWQCTQTLELRSSAEARVEEVFFNQVAALPQAGLFLLTNAKKNTIYAIHLEYAPNPIATRMDYIAEFTVTMPILSFTGTCEVLPHGEQVIQIYCVQTQAIQQYALELSQCFPSTMENVVFERSDSNISRDAANVDGLATLQPSGSKLSEIPLASTASKPSLLESSSESVSVRHPASSAADAITSQELSTLRMNSKAVSLPMTIGVNDISCVPSSLPLSPRLSHKHSGLGSPTNSIEPVLPLGNHGGEQKVIEYSVDRQMESVHTNLSHVPYMDDDSRNDEKKAAQNDNSMFLNHHVKYKHPTHLVTPAEILMGSSTSEANDKLEHKSEVERNIHDVVINSDMQNVEVEVKVFGETGFTQTNESGFQGEACGFTSENREKLFCSQTSDLGSEMTRESTETYIMGESRKIDGPNGSENMAKSCTEEEVLDSAKVVAGKTVDSAAPTTAAQTSVQSAKGKKHKGKNAQGSGSSSPSPIALDPIDSSIEPDVGSGILSTEAVFPQVMAMQKMLNQLTILQKEMQKQMAVMVTVPVTKEGRRLEAALGKNMEKAIKSNVDTMWGHFQKENARQEKLARDRMQQITNLITNCVNKDLPAAVEKTVKKELAMVGPAVAHTISPTVEKTVSTAIAEAFQRVGDKAINQLERSISLKLEATVARQIQAQFETSGKQALQEILKSNLEASVIPAFEVSCKAMFNQVDATFQKGMAEHTTAAQLQLESTHSQLALGLRDAINSASSVTQMLSGELADSQRKLLALALTGASPKSGNSLISQLSNGHLGGLHENIETSLDPTRELTRMISEHKYDEAFTAALQRSDVSIVSWLCSQVDLLAILLMNPLPLSQGVLISLLQQLACDTSKDTPQKLSWMRDVIVAINPTDPMISVHVRPIFDQVYQILNHHRGLPTTSNAEISSIRVVMHIINSMLMTCK